VGSSAGVFNAEKLLWLNAHYIKECASDRLVELVRTSLAKRGYDTTDEHRLGVVTEVLRPRVRTLDEFADKAAPYYVREIEVEPAAAKKWLKAKTAPVLVDLLEAFRQLPEWEEESLEGAFLSVVEGKHGLKIGKGAQPLRVAITGATASPGIYETLYLVGREWTLERIENAVSIAQARETPA
jgi:glutamyl-tRNA synthetase